MKVRPAIGYTLPDAEILRRFVRRRRTPLLRTTGLRSAKRLLREPTNPDVSEAEGERWDTTAGRPFNSASRGSGFHA